MRSTRASGRAEPEGARWRWNSLKNSEAYQAVTELMGLDWPAGEHFEKTQAIHDQPSPQRQRTNNHVERADRRPRFGEKPRYKWRRHKSLVRFFLLRISRHAAKTKPPGTTTAAIWRRLTRTSTVGISENYLI